MKKAPKLILIILLLLLSISNSASSKPISWDRFAKDLTAISKLHLDLALTKSALKDFKNHSISRAEAIYLTIEALGLGFEASLLQETNLLKNADLPDPIKGAIALSTLLKPPLLEMPKTVSLKWFRESLSEREAKALIDKALHLKNNGGKVSFHNKIDKDLELHWERTLNPNLYMAYLKLNPRSNNLILRIGLAGNQVQTREKLSDICKRLNAIGGVNGGFFKADGDPVGALMIDGVLISEPFPKRSCFGWNDKGEFVFGRINWEATLETQGGTNLNIDGLNRKPNGEEIIIYTPFYGEALSLEKETTMIIVRNWKIYEIKRSSSEIIPVDGFIIAGYGEKERLLEGLTIDEGVSIKAYLIPEKKNPLWKRVNFVIEGGPMLIENGEIVSYDEGFSEELIVKKHPRTIIGETYDGKLIFMVIDGRNPRRSEGLTIEELKLFLKKLNFKNALNLDGGGSTTLYLKGKLYNTPSDGKERDISYGLVILKGNR